MEELFDGILHLISILIYIIAFVVIFRFYFKLKGEKYWIGLPLSIFFYMLHEVCEIIEDFTNTNMMLFIEGFEIIASLILIISVYGLSQEMVKIHKLENIADDEED